MRLTPFHPAWYPNRLSEALIMLGEYEEAKTVLAALLAKESEEAVSLRGKSRALVALSVIAGLQGDIKNGTEKQLLKLRKDPLVALAKSLNSYYDIHIKPVVSELDLKIKRDMKIMYKIYFIYYLNTKIKIKNC